MAWLNGLTLATCSFVLLALQSCVTTLHAETAQTAGQEESVAKPTIKFGDFVEVPVGDGGRTLGRLKAPLVLMEFTDYACPYCVGFHEKTFPELKTRFIDKGILRFMVRDMPLEFHPHALPMARAARCADAQSAFWKVNSLLYDRQFNRMFIRTFISSEISTGEALDQIAEAASLDKEKFRKCFASTDLDKSIATDMANFAAINASGTPTFVLGRISGNKLSGIAIPGAYPTETFVRLIEEKHGK
jgi:protein-disulfide isomerase